MATILRLADGTVLSIPFVGDRFFHKDFGEITDQFTAMNGWSMLKALADIILFFRPFCVVELGAGLSTPVLANAAEKMGVKMHTVDKKPEKKVELFDGHTYHNMLTEDFMKVFDEKPGLVFIDADHSYEMSKREFEFFYPKLVPGGVIFLHDTYPPHEIYLRETGCHDVYKLRQELEGRTEELDCDVFTWPYTAQYMGLTMVIKKDPERPYFGR